MLSRTPTSKRGDTGLLTVLALGFALVGALKVAVTWLRELIVIILQNTLHFAFGARLFRHLLRLPLSFFDKRHIGDVLSRFASIEPVRNLISEGLLLALIDGVMAAMTLAIMFAYSARLALIVVFVFLLYCAIRIAFFRVLRDFNETAIQMKALETSNFVETLRAMQSIKLFNHESQRESVWLNRFADTINADVRVKRANAAFQAINGTLFGAENIIIIYLAAGLALGNVFTVGMVFAFITYKQLFISKANGLVEKALDFGIVGLHLERLSDIALAQLEDGHDTPVLTRPIFGGLVVRNLSFRYSETDEWVLQDINFSVGAGQFVMIRGPSGSGKTTLMKILVGLLQPTSGEVLVDGVALHSFGVRGYREQIAAVMQENSLLSGSIAENICFFATSIDEKWMVECAEIARVHDEVLKLPMGYNTQIGDMGSTLSGGQKQRIVLARALYRRPKILFLDEATAHLDGENEKQVSENLKALNITRICVAHRSELAEGAQLILHVGDAPPQLEPMLAVSESKALHVPR